MNNAFDNEIRFKLLKLLQEEPELTQRDMNRKMGISLGKVNYCISAFTQKGLIKIERFKKAQKKSSYIYRLTPKGMEELTSLTLSYLKIKLKEYDQIKMEIKSLSGQINDIDPTMMEELKNIS